jgi:hypothetical protein
MERKLNKNNVTVKKICIGPRKCSIFLPMMAILLGLLDPKARTTCLQPTINPATQHHVPKALNHLIS